MICCTATLPLLAPKLEAGDIHKEPTPGHTPPNIHAIAGAGNVSELQKAANSQTAGSILYTRQLLSNTVSLFRF
jgi:hypothetical protein